MIEAEDWKARASRSSDYGTCSTTSPSSSSSDDDGRPRGTGTASTPLNSLSSSFSSEIRNELFLARRPDRSEGEARGGRQHRGGRGETRLQQEQQDPVSRTSIGEDKTRVELQVPSSGSLSLLSSCLCGGEWKEEEKKESQPVSLMCGHSLCAGCCKQLLVAERRAVVNKTAARATSFGTGPRVGGVGAQSLRRSRVRMGVNSYSRLDGHDLDASIHSQSCLNEVSLLLN